MSDFTILPPGTLIYPPNDAGEVVLKFPTKDDGIIFVEFVRAWVEHKIKLTATEDEDAPSSGEPSPDQD